MTGGLTLGAALMLGIAASGHCLVMCGGISGALGLATAKRADGRSRISLVIGYQTGRMLSYAVAGALVGGALGIVVRWLDFDAVRFKRVAEERQSFFRLRQRAGGDAAGRLALDHITSTGAGDVDVIRLLQFLDEFRKAVGAKSAFAKGGVQLNHRRLQQAQLRLRFLNCERLHVC